MREGLSNFEVIMTGAATGKGTPGVPGTGTPGVPGTYEIVRSGIIGACVGVGFTGVVLGEHEGVVMWNFTSGYGGVGDGERDFPSNFLITSLTFPAAGTLTIPVAATRDLAAANEAGQYR